MNGRESRTTRLANGSGAATNVTGRVLSEENAAPRPVVRGSSRCSTTMTRLIADRSALLTMRRSVTSHLTFEIGHLVLDLDLGAAIRAVRRHVHIDGNDTSGSSSPMRSSSAAPSSAAVSSR